MVIRVEPGVVKRAAANLRTQQEGGKKKIKLDDPVAAGAGHPGWRVATASNGCIKAWRDRLHRLGENARQASEELTESMDAVTSTDGSIAEDLAADAAWLRNA